MRTTVPEPGKEARKKPTRTGNAGFQELEIVGWVEKPRYDAASHRLWSMSARRKGPPERRPVSINYNTYAWAARGYILNPDRLAVGHPRRTGPRTDAAGRAELQRWQSATATSMPRPTRSLNTAWRRWWVAWLPRNWGCSLAGGLPGQVRQGDFAGRAAVAGCSPKFQTQERQA